MKICGIKLTHDGAIALIDDGELIFSVEMEKILNNPRYASINDISIVEETLASYGYLVEEIDSFVIDGWNKEHMPTVMYNDTRLHLTLNGYDPITNNSHILDIKKFKIQCSFTEFKSYHHISGHVLGAYCSSPFSNLKKSSFLLVWDGAIGPQLYYYCGVENQFKTIGWVHYIYGCAYAQFANHFPPFNSCDIYDMSTPGKLMAYIANGNVQDDLLNSFFSTYYEMKNIWEVILDDSSCRKFSQKFLSIILKICASSPYTSDDFLATFHAFLGDLTVKELLKIVRQYPNYEAKLCYSGGCALNIKWNSALRSSEIFEEIWIPPFPNDAGSAIGAACCEMVKSSNNFHLRWNMFAGPELLFKKNLNQNWIEINCSLKSLSKIIYYLKEPVVFLTGKAELGPRALGHRSILADPSSLSMKKKINSIKGREDYRPIAPMCKEERAKEFFFPGTPDPLMLFDHKIIPEKLHLIPAVSHIDGTARLQTVNYKDNPEIYELLSHYESLSGFPILCNSSANFNGKGFFPDVESAIEWGKSNIIWSGGKLWFNSENVDNSILKF